LLASKGILSRRRQQKLQSGSKNQFKTCYKSTQQTQNATTAMEAVTAKSQNNNEIRRINLHERAIQSTQKGPIRITSQT